MYSGADYSVTPRPMYPADGRKLPDVYTRAAGAARRAATAQLGTFPLFNFWGPAPTSRRRGGSPSARSTSTSTRQPTLTLVYLPHLDYNLQRLGPDDPRLAEDLREVDAICGELIDHVRAAGARVIVLSEYGITPVTRPVHINRALRQRGPARGAARARARDARRRRLRGVRGRRPPDRARLRERPERDWPRSQTLLERLDGVERVLDATGKRAAGLDHPRSGELVAIAQADRWFTYYYWLDDDRAPDYARTVDIHRKPGYDPVELFLDPDDPVADAQGRRRRWRGRSSASAI